MNTIFVEDCSEIPEWIFEKEGIAICQQYLL
jgi:hypothetical protein